MIRATLPRTITTVVVILSGGLVAAGCTARGSAQENGNGAPPPVVIETEEAGVATVDHPEQFPLATAARYEARPALSVTGVVTSDV